MSTPPETRRYQTAEEAARIYLLPNLFTAGNMLCGFLAIKNCIEAHFTNLDSVARSDHYITAVWFIIFACVCDLFDGRIARATHRESLFGAEFDSIADTVSFGVAPALMVCFLIINPNQNEEYIKLSTWLLAFIYLLCAGVRLARFNVLTNPLIPGNEKRSAGGDFVGLPSPAAAGLIASIVLALSRIVCISNPNNHLDLVLKSWSWVLLPLMLVVSYLMISNVRFPSLKKINWDTRTKSKGFVFIILGDRLYSFFENFLWWWYFLVISVGGWLDISFILKKKKQTQLPKMMKMFLNC
jgi:CDP-diacylglycerol--serine O-phosphatidyltransferase